MKTSHTPGPWDDCSKNETGETIRIFAKSHYIGSIGNSDDPAEQTAANARLIAAAPELLALAQSFVAWSERSALNARIKGGELLSMARAGIAKAEGYDQ